LIFAFLLQTSSAQASPPLPSDLAVTLRVESSTDPLLRPGAHAILAFDVRQLGPVSTGGYFIRNEEVLVASVQLQPFRLSEIPGSGCLLVAYEDVATNPPVRYYYLSGEMPAIGELRTCRVTLDVFNSPAGYLASFQIFSTDDKNWYDPVEGNNVANLPLGGPRASAVPSVGRFAVLTLMLGLLVAAISALCRRRTR
jgi:hypothetical protein